MEKGVNRERIDPQSQQENANPLNNNRGIRKVPSHRHGLEIRRSSCSHDWSIKKHRLCHDELLHQQYSMAGGAGSNTDQIREIFHRPRSRILFVVGGSEFSPCPCDVAKSPPRSRRFSACRVLPFAVDDGMIELFARPRGFLYCRYHISGGVSLASLSLVYLAHTNGPRKLESSVPITIYRVVQLWPIAFLPSHLFLTWPTAS